MNSVGMRIEQANRLELVTQRVGFALWQLQVLEEIAAGYLVLVSQAQRGMGHEAGEELLAMAESATFGTTVKKMAEAELLDDQLERSLRNLLRERNWLVHRSRKDSRASVHSDDALATVVGRIEAISDEVLRLLKVLDERTEKFVKGTGVTSETMNKAAEELLDSWHKGDDAL